MKTSIYIPIFLLVASTISCTSIEVKPEDQSIITCDTSRIITFSGDISPFMNTSCGSTNINCHSSAASSMIPLDSYVGVQYFSQTGQVMNSVNWISGASQMPKSAAKLSSCEIALLQKWVNEGEPNN